MPSSPYFQTQTSPSFAALPPWIFAVNMSVDTSFSHALYELWAWFELHKKRILIAVVGLFVLSAVIAALIVSRNQRERRASEQLAALVPSHISGQSLVTRSADEYLALAKTYPKTRAGQRALLLAAEALFSQQQYSQAREQFERFRRDFPDSPVVANAAYGVAASLEAENKFDQALTAYQEVLSRHPNDGSYGQSKLALARLYERKEQFQRALEIYNELTRPNVMSVWSSDANLAREQLLARHPELAPTNVPAISSSSPGLGLPPGLLRDLNQATGLVNTNTSTSLSLRGLTNAFVPGTNLFNLSLTNLIPAKTSAAPVAKTNSP